MSHERDALAPCPRKRPHWVRWPARRVHFVRPTPQTGAVHRLGQGALIVPCLRYYCQRPGSDIARVHFQAGHAGSIPVTRSTSARHVRAAALTGRCAPGRGEQWCALRAGWILLQERADRGLRGGQGLAVSESAGTPRSGRVGSGASPAPSKRATKRPRGPGRPDAPLAAPTDSTGASGLAGIVGGGQSQVGISGAMRARDVSRPRPEDDEAAERETVVRRRPGNAASPASVPPHRPAAGGGHQGSGGNSPDRS